MKRIIMTKGLPGSGKTTWAKQYQSNNPNTVRVNKDELRAMLHNGVHSKGRESFVLDMRDYVIINAVLSGHDVIVDDTNLNPIHEQKIKHLFDGVLPKVEVEFEIKDFTDISIETCIKNDLKRPNSVGSRVIWDQYNKWLKLAPIPAPEYNPELKTCIICDLDGTLALFGDANPYERDFSKDEVNTVVRDLISLYADEKPSVELILTSGRKNKFEDQTRQWLITNGINFDHLFMRKTEDDRKDFIVKKEIYENEIKGKYNVQFVLDDRNQVVELWRSLGLTCFQVADGNF